MTVTEALQRVAVSIDDAAHLIGIGRQSAYAAAKSGELPTVRMGRRLLVPVGPLFAKFDIPLEQDS